MTELRIGEAYVAKRVYKGHNNRGPYEMIVVQNVGKKQPKIAISPTNVPTGIGPNAVFKLTTIRSVQNRNWRDKKGTWHVGGQVTIRGKVKPLVQLGPKELEKLNYKETKPEFPSLEDFFNNEF